MYAKVKTVRRGGRSYEYLIRKFAEALSVPAAFVITTMIRKKVRKRLKCGKGNFILNVFF